MNNRQELRETEKVKRLGHFVSFKGKTTQRVCEPIKFLKIESNRNVNDSKLFMEIKSKMKQVEGVVITNALGLD